MTVFVPESIHILGTDGGGLSVVLCSMYVDTLADLPAPTAYTGYRLSMGCTARVIADNSRHRINSAGQWVDITENDGKYTLPPATSNSLGGIMVGSGLTIDSAGMLSGDFSALWDSIYQTEKHLTGAPPLSFMASGDGIEAAVIYGNGQQTGTPTQQNIIMPDLTGKRTGNLYPLDANKLHVGRIGNDGTIGYKEGTVTISGDTVTYTGTNAWRGFYTDLIPVDDDEKLTISPVTSQLAFSCNCYDENGYYIGKASTVSESNYRIFTLVQGTTAVRISVASGSNTYTVTEPMLNIGRTSLPYEPYGWKIPFTCAGQTVPVYLGQVSTVRRIRKLVFDGTESWDRSTSGNNTRVYTSQIPECMSLSPAICTHFDYNVANVGYPKIGEFVINSSKAIIFGIDGNVFVDVDAWKSYLAQQYAAGTPVTVWYVLAEPTTGIVNEPLCKIGDYCDELHSTDAGISIQTVRGQNTLTIGTTLQPSKISITYF